MRRALVLVLVGLTLLIGTALPAQAARVYCQAPTPHRVVCYNTTQYRVHVQLRLYTTAGLRLRYFTIRYTRYTIYSAPAIIDFRYRWRF